MRSKLMITGIALVVLALALFIASSWFSPAAKTVTTPRVLITTMFQMGDPQDPSSPGEATLWVQKHQLNNVINIPGAYSPLYCDQRGDMCLVITGVGVANSAMTMTALGLSDQLDLSKTYILMAGIGGVNPNVATIESIAWADWVVDTATTSEYDAREMPADFKFPKMRYACATQWCDDPYIMGTEIFQINPELVAWGYNLTKDIKLQESDHAKARRAEFEQESARQSPGVSKCTITGGNTFWHGKLMSDWASWWVDQWTGGKSYYCMTAVEENGVIPAIHNLGKSGRYDPQRAMIVRVGSNFDQQPPNMTAGESFSHSLNEVNQAVGMENLHQVAWTVAEHILQHWAEWEKGVPAQP